MTHLTHLLNDVEAARLLRLPVRRLVQLARAGRLPAVDFGDGELRFDPEDLTAFINGSKSQTPPAHGTGGKAAGVELSLR